MSLRRVKVLYCVAVVSIAVVLVCAAGLIGWIVAIIVLAGALPMFGAIHQIGAHYEKQRTLTAITDLFVPTPDRLSSPEYERAAPGRRKAPSHDAGERRASHRS